MLDLCVDSSFSPQGGRRTWGFLPEKKIHEHYVETAGEKSLKLWLYGVCCLTVLASTDQGNTWLLGLKGLKIPRGGVEPPEPLSRKEGLNSKGRCYLPAFVRTFYRPSK